MLSTKNLETTIDKIPSYWVFQYYLNLQEQLTGQDLKIKSLFNPAERTPSFCVYVDKSIMQYKFKDFSTGKTGDKIDLVKELFNLDFFNAVQKILTDYNKCITGGKVSFTNLKPQAKWKIDFVKIRQWNKRDAKFWLAFNIGSSILENCKVKPIHYYTMVKEIDNEFETIKFEKPMMYGYFNNSNELIKIYQPYNKKQKFYNVKDYLQGLDQLEYKYNNLVICSSLKDAMCLKSFNYKLEVLAPSSENTMIKPYIINNLKTKYKKVITLFDNDEAGKKAINAYKKLYDIDGCALPICKDLSDAVKKHGFEIINKELKPLLIETLKK